MPKNTKSSASSATRKKQAARAAKKSGGQGNDGPVAATDASKSQQPKQRGQKKGKNKEPKKKVFIPPQKPKAEIIDPLDSQGLAALLPSDLVVLLRKASKKDVVTRIRAVEGLIAWIKGEAAANTGDDLANGKQRAEHDDVMDDASRQSAIIVALPSWAFLYPRLASSPNRRLRQMTAQVHAMLLSDPAIASELVAQTHLVEQFLGQMLTLAHGPDRLVSRMAKSTWEEHTIWEKSENDDGNKAAVPRIVLRDYNEILVSHIETLICHEARGEGSNGAQAGSGGGISTPSALATPLGASRDVKNRDDVNVEEDVEATDARLCAGALGALSWIASSPAPEECRDAYLPILSASTTWTALMSQESVNDRRVLGRLSPNVRITAWQLLRTVVGSWPAAMNPVIETAGARALHSAFAESDALVAQAMREALVTLVRARPEVWKLGQNDADNDDDESEDDEDASEDEEDDTSSEADEKHADTSTSSEQNGKASPQSWPLFASFVEYLRSGLRGVSASYDVLIVLLASMPVTVLPTTQFAASTVLEAVYAPFDEGILDGRPAQRAFLSAFLECLPWLCGRVKNHQGVKEASEVASLARMPWTDFIDAAVDSTDESTTPINVDSRISTIGEDRLVLAFASLLRKFYNIDASVARPLLDLSRQTLHHAITSQVVPADIVCNILSKSCEPSSAPTQGLQEAVNGIVQDVMGVTSNLVASGEASLPGLEVMTLLLNNFPSAHDEHNRQVSRLVFDQLLTQRTTRDSSSGERMAFLTAYAVRISDGQERRETWQSLLSSLVIDGKVDWSSLRAMMRTSDDHLENIKESEGSALDQALVSSRKENISVVGRLVARPVPFIRPDTVKDILEAAAKDTSSTEDLTIFRDWLRIDAQHIEEAFRPPIVGSIPVIFAEGVLRGNQVANATWKLLSTHQDATTIAMSTLRNELLQVSISADAIVNAVRAAQPPISLDSILPTNEVMWQFLSSACEVPTPSTLSILDALVPQSDDRSAVQTQYDSSGLSIYARCCSILIQGLEDDEAKEGWKLPHLIAVVLASSDAELEYGGGSALFQSALAIGTLRERGIALLTSLFSRMAPSLPQNWSLTLTEKAQGKDANCEDMLLKTLCAVMSTSGAERVFAQMIKGIIDYGDMSDSDLQGLLRTAQAAEKRRPEMARAIYLATKNESFETPLHDRLRNQAAAELSGIKPAEASVKGLAFLQALVDLAPLPDSSASLIPQQRCIFLLQSMQAWIASDESVNFPPELYTRLCQLFTHIVPVVQDMAGSHLDLIVDVLEMQLAEADVRSKSGKIQLYFALRLFEVIDDLQRHSTILREAWETRSAEVFAAIHDLIIELARPQDNEDATVASVPRNNFDTLVADVGHSLSPALFKNDIESLVPMIKSQNSVPLRILAYRLLSHNIREHVKELVIEAAVRSEKSQDADAQEILSQPHEVAQIPGVLIAGVKSEQDDTLSRLLSWLTIFEYFEESSVDLRAIYTSQVQSTKAVETDLIPLVLSRMTPASDPGRWVIDEVFLDHIDTGSETAIDILALHIFYRSLVHVPNLVRDASLSIKDRQQSMQLKTLITRHLSPLLSQREFGHLREKELLDRLQDENMQIRVAANASEVMATYTIDEHPLEIAISMPNDYPLRPVEVRDIRNVGISEGTWRAWILGIRQLIAGRNGLVYDALLLFKRNVEAKFSGFDEDSTCAVCYSIVSPTDHSLPTKPCKTCKKKFHASCLYKWVSTSGSSTCPMCRSIL